MLRLGQTWQRLLVLQLLLMFAVVSFALDVEDEGYRLNNGNNLDINVHNVCRNVVNSSGLDHFIATGSISEWLSFLAGPPSGLTVNACTPDPNWANVVLLIQPTVEDSIIYDLSDSHHPVSAVGGAALNTSISDPWGGSRKIIFFDGIDDLLAIPDSNDWFMGTGDVTLEAWVYHTELNGGSNYTVFGQNVDNANGVHYRIHNGGNSGYRFRVRQSNSNIISLNEGSDYTTTGRWDHMAYTRSGTSHRLFRNGTQVAFVSDASSWLDYSTSLTIGADAQTDLSGIFKGYMGAVRITKGVARYTSNFTPDTEPWVAPDDYVPDTISWADFNNQSSSQTFTGFNKPLDVQVSASYFSGTPTIKYQLGNGAWTEFSPGSPANITVHPGQTLAFNVSGSDTESADITVYDNTNSSTLDTVRGTVSDDPNWGNVVLLIQPSSSDSVPVDLSSSTHVISQVGDASLSGIVTSPSGGKSVSLDGTGDYLSIPDSNDWYFGSGDFTWEVWIQWTSVFFDSDQSIITQTQVDGNYQAFFLDNWNDKGLVGIAFDLGGSKMFESLDGVDRNLNVGQWYHLAFTRSGSTYRVFLDGVQVSTTTNASSLPDYNGDLTIGADDQYPGWELSGYIGSVRITKGVARYTGNFTPENYFYFVEDNTPDAIAWADFMSNSSQQTLSGFNTSVNLELSAVYVTGTPTIEYNLNGSGWTAFTPSSSASVNVSSGNTLEFRVSGGVGDEATITVTNITDGSAVLDTVTGTVPMVQAISYSGASYNFVVPAGTTELVVKAWGAGGGGGAGGSTYGGGNGGGGGYAAANLAVTPSETLTLEVGGAGLSSSTQTNGGGGGGRTTVKRSSTILLAAGAGGGGGGGENSVAGANGGAGGGTTGLAGSNAGTANAGQGGTQATGGALGTGENNGVAGSSEIGGAGGDRTGQTGDGGAGGTFGGGAGGKGDASSYGGGGGGGAGYYGGGGGGGAPNSSAGAGGGGGSGYVSGTDTSLIAGSGLNVANSSDADYPGGGVGQGGNGGATGSPGSDGGNGHIILYYVAAPDYVPDVINWADFDNESSTESFSGITRTLDIRLSLVNNVGTPTVQYKKNSGAWTTFTSGSPADIQVDGGDNLQFRVQGYGNEQATITVTNLSDSNNVIDTMVGTVADEYWDDVVLLVQPTATDTFILDTSSKGHVITANGDAALATPVADPWGGARKLITFDGTNDFLSTPDSDDWFFGTGDVTFEAYVYFPSINGSSDYVFFSQASNDNNVALTNLNNNSNQGTGLFVRQGGTEIIGMPADGDSSATQNTWYHIALTRSGNTWRAFLNGNLENTITDTSPWFDVAGQLTFGQTDAFSGAGDLNGYVTGIRITKGVARYTSAFTPPSEPFIVSMDSSPSSMDWGNFVGESSAETFLGMNQTINVELSASNVSGTPTYEYSKNGGGWTSFTTVTPASVIIDAGDNLKFRITGSEGEKGQITVTNLSDSNTVLDSVQGMAIDNPRSSCSAYLAESLTIGDGIYPVDPDGSGGSSSFDVYCDMTTSGGGWMLIYNTPGNTAYSAGNIGRSTLNPSSPSIENSYAIDFYDQWGVGYGTQGLVVNQQTAANFTVSFSGNWTTTPGYGALRRPTSSLNLIVSGNTWNFAGICHNNAAAGNGDNCDGNNGAINGQGLFSQSANDEASNCGTWFWKSNTGGNLATNCGTGSYFSLFVRNSSVNFSETINWENFNLESSEEVFDNITELVHINLSTSYISGSPTISYNLNDGGWVAFTPGSDADIWVNQGATLKFQVTGDFSEQASITVTNITDSNTTLDTFIGTVADQYWDNVVLMIQPKSGDSSVLDYSNSGHIISENGDTSLGTPIADPWGGSEKLILLDGTGDYLQIPDSADWNFATGDFTVEGWFYMPTLSGSSVYAMFAQHQNGTNTAQLLLNNSGNRGLQAYMELGASVYVDTNGGGDTSASSSNWHHIAYVRDGNIFRFFLNGTEEYNQTDTSSWQDVAAPLRIGGRNGDYFLDGHIGSYRVTKGVARYTSNFTRPSEPFLVNDDYTPAAINWEDFNNQSWAKTFTSINKTLSLELSATNFSGSPTLEYQINSGAWTEFTTLTPANIFVGQSDTLSFRVAGSDGESADITITNTSDSNSVIDTVRGSVTVDPYLANVVLFIQPGTGDSSPNDLSASTHTLTLQNDATMNSSLSSPSGGKVISLDGSDDYVSSPDSDDWYWGTGDFTLEGWFYLTDLNTSNGAAWLGLQYVNSTNGWGTGILNNGSYGFYSISNDGSTVIFVGEGSNRTSPVNTWVHLAYVRDSDNHNFYVDGTLVHTAFDNSQYPQLSTELRVGDSVSGDTEGHMGSLRYTKGVARYTSNFTPDPYFYYVVDKTPDAINWADFMNSSETKTFTGLNTQISVELSATYDSGTPTIEYSKSGGGWLSFTPGSPATVNISRDDTLAFRLNGIITDEATITVTNLSDGNTVLDTVTGLIPSQTLLTYSGASQNFVVPTGTTELTVRAWGAGGGGAGGGTSGGGGTGGGGAYAQATFSVTPSETLTVNVGGGGGLGAFSTGGGGALSGDGGGGGGYTGILRSSTPLIVAAGGGGGGGGDNSSATAGGAGAPGGATNGSSGGTSGSAGGGAGGTSGAGGAGGTGGDTAGLAGSSLTGGAGTDGVSPGTHGSMTNGGSFGGANGGEGDSGSGNGYGGGGGGGAGYYGGGGGSNSATGNAGGGGGGSGSSYVTGTNTSMIAGSGQNVANALDPAYPGGGFGQGGDAGGTNSSGTNGGNGYIALYYIAAADYSADAINWSDFYNFSTPEVVTGVTRTLNVQLSVSYNTGTPTVEYRLNGGSWTGFTSGSPVNILVNSGDALEFQVDGNHADQATITITNTSDSNTVLDTVVATVRKGIYLQTVRDEANQSSYTFSSQNLGAADANRVIIVGIVGLFYQSGVTAPTVTIGGVSATVHEFDDASSGDWGIRAVLASAIVPTGTTGDITVAWNRTSDRTEVHVYQVVGTGSTPTYSGIASNAFNYNTYQNINSFQESSSGFTVLAGAWDPGDCDYDLYEGAYSSTTPFSHTMIDQTNGTAYSSAYRNTTTSFGPSTIHVRMSNCTTFRGKGYVWGHWAF